MPPVSAIIGTGKDILKDIEAICHLPKPKLSTHFSKYDNGKKITQNTKLLFYFIFQINLFIFIIVVLGVHCDIYQSSYTIS
jgi:hypothetical protein